jgi:hypothetical protein
MTKMLVFFINQQTSTMVPEKMVHGSISQSPEKLEKSWSSTPPSGPRRITQWSTANYPAVHKQTQSQKQSAAAPAVASDEEDDEEDEAMAEKTKKSPWPPKSVSAEVSNDERQAGHFLCPLVTVDLVTEWSTAAQLEQKS